MSRLFTQLRLRLCSLFHRSKVERELDEELQYHLEREIDEGLTKGLAANEARFAALRCGRWEPLRRARKSAGTFGE